MMRWLPWLVLLAVSACSNVYQPKDSAPPIVIPPEEISDAVPRFEVIGRAGNRTPYEVGGITYHVLPSPAGYVAEGTASWYGTKFHNRNTSNGEVFNMYAMTAAHKTLPLPCYAKVTNLENGKTAIVRINDRGPFHSDRIIDLSFAAASKLDFMRQGTARVKVEVIDPASLQSVADHGEYFLQVGAFSQRDRAEAVLAEVSALINHPGVVEQDKKIFRAKIGPIKTYALTDSLMQAIQSHGFAKPLLIRPRQ